MPSSSEHKEKAEKNSAFLAQAELISPEWAATIAFYVALHLVERLCACENTHSGKHQDRLSWINKHKTHRLIHADFLALFDASLVARYGTVNQFARAFPEDTVKAQLIDKNLAAIQKHVSNHFVTSSAPPLSPPHQMGVATPKK
jgi:hypothetical protein